VRISAVSWSLVWAAAIKSPVEIIVKTDCNNQDSLQIADKPFASNAMVNRWPGPVHTADKL